MSSFISTLKEAFNGEEKDFTSGSINKAIVILAIPMIFEMLGESAFAVFDAYFVGRLGSYALSTVGLTESILFIIYSLAIGISTGVTALVSRRTGEGDRKAAADVTFQSMIISLFISLLISLIGYYFSDNILLYMGADNETVEKGTGYIQVMLVYNLPILFLFMLNGAFRGAGFASTAMWSLMIGNIANIILDPLLIFGYAGFPEMGLTGAAVASFVGRGLGVLYQVYHLYIKDTFIKIRKNNIRFDSAIVIHILKISGGAIFQYFINSFSWIILIRITASLGQQAVAAYTITLRIIVFSLMPSWGLANAAATLVGQNLGAKQADRAEKSVWKAAHYNALFLLGVSILYLLFAADLAAIFTEEKEVLDTAAIGLMIVAAGYIFYGYGMIISQSFNGAGDTYTPMFINIFAFIIVQSPLAYFLAIELNMNDPGLYIAIAVSYSISAMIGMFIFRRGKWKLKEV